MKRAALQIDKTPRMVIQSNPTTLFRYHFQVTNFFTKQLGMGRFECGVELMADWGTPAITESDRLVADIVSPIWHDQRGATGRASPPARSSAGRVSPSLRDC